MTMFDIAVIAILLVSGVLAYARGFVHEVLSIAGWIGATFAALYATPVLKPFMLQVIEDEFFASLVLGIVIFIASLVILSLLTRSISRKVKDSALGALDRALGLLFGFLRGAVVVSLAYIAYEWVIPAEDQGPWVRDARTIQWVEVSATALKALAPTDDEAPADGEETEQSTRDKVQQMFKDAITPKAENQSDADADGYDKKEREELDRLLGTVK